MADSQRKLSVLTAGTVIACANPDCRVRIASFRKDLLAGAPDIGVDVFEWGPGQKRDAGSSAECYVCGTPFMRTRYDQRNQALPSHEIHLHEYGWTHLR